jgi:hypothetical protein
MGSELCRENVYTGERAELAGPVYKIESWPEAEMANINHQL